MRLLKTFDPRRSLRARIALIVAGLTLVLSLVLTLAAGNIATAQLKHSIGQTLADLSSTMVSQLGQTMFERWREIRNTATQTDLFLSKDNASTVRTLFDQLKGSYRDYAWIGWADPAGLVVASSGGLLEGKSVADSTWFKQAQIANTPYIADARESVLFSDGQLDVNGQPPRFIELSTAIRTPNGQLLGVLGVYLDWRFMREQSQAIETQFAKQNGVSDPTLDAVDVYILSSDGRVLIGPSVFGSSLLVPFYRVLGPILIQLRQIAISFHIISAQPTQLSLQSVENARSGQTGYLTEIEPSNGVSYLTGYAKDTGFRGYPGLGWIGLIRERSDVALASVSQLQLSLLGISVLFSLFFSVLGWLLMVQITRPLAQVAQIAREIMTGRTDEMLVNLHGDEVTVLSATIDRLLISLNSRNEQLTDLNAKLEHLVQERTAELAASQRFNEKMISTAPDIVYIFDFKQLRTTYMNQAVRSLLGYTANEMIDPSTDLLLRLIHPDDVAAYRANHEMLRFSPDGTLTEQTYRVKHRDGRWLWLNCRETSFLRDDQGQAIQLLGFAQDITLRRQAEERLQEEAASQERQRLARELHDSVTQTLFSATMVAQTLPLLWDRGETVVRKNLDELARLTGGALAEMRTLLNELRPQAIETADLSELLTQLSEAVRGRTQAECSVTITGSSQLPMPVKVAAYRVAQEALNNVTKHARAHYVQVLVKLSKDGVDMRIQDDGRGFRAEQTSSNHFGLGIMVERAQEINAEVTVDSQPGKGTVVTFHWKAQPVSALALLN